MAQTWWIEKRMSFADHVLVVWADRHRVARWWVVGLVFTVLNIPVIYFLVDVLLLPLAAATVIAGEIGLLARFLVNDHWVFREDTPMWKRLRQYHLASASSFTIWWIVTNLLPRWGIHYVVAALIGTVCSSGWSMLTNFLWVWRPLGVVDEIVDE